jgi:hypothetical protein
MIALASIRLMLNRIAYETFQTPSNVFDVGEAVPTSDIAVFTVTLKLQNEFLH